MLKLTSQYFVAAAKLEPVHGTTKHVATHVEDQLLINQQISKLEKYIW